MKNFALLLIAGTILGCVRNPVGEHCYVVSALYLIDGVQRPAVGYVEDVFYDHNNNPDLSLLYHSGIALESVWEHQTNDCRVVVVYDVGNGMNHSRPMEYHEQLGFDPIGYYISCLKERVE